MTNSRSPTNPSTYTTKNMHPAEVYLDRNKCLKVVRVEMESHTERNDKYISGYGYVFTHVGFNSDGEMLLEKSQRGFIEMLRISPDNSSQLENEILSGINTAVRICHERAQRVGWWDKYDTAPDHLKPDLLAGRQMLMVSELAEAMEGLRKDRKDDHLPHRKSEEVELADAVIRIFDYAGKRGFDLGNAILEKMAYNLTRADHKPENRAKVGGKCF